MNNIIKTYDMNGNVCGQKVYNNDGRLGVEYTIKNGKVESTTRYRYEGSRRVAIVETDADGNIINEWHA